MATTTDSGETTSNELELVAAAKAGRVDAFEELVRRYSGMVFAVAYARTSDRETAEDLAQEVFLRAYTGLSSLAEPRFFSTWLSRIARNRATDWQRTGQRRSRAVAMLALEEVVDMHDPRMLHRLEDAHHTAQQEAELGRALGRLSAEQREIVLLHYAEDWSLTDISRKLNVHRTTVSRHLDQALNLLRADIAPLLRVNCKAARSSGRLPAKAAAAFVAFAVLPAVSRAQVVGKMAALSISGGAELPSAAGTVAKTAIILNPGSAAAAAGGTAIMTKTTVAAVAVVAGLIAAGYYAKAKTAVVPPAGTETAGAAAMAQLEKMRQIAPSDSVSIKPSTSKNRSMSTGMGSFVATSMDLQNAVSNAFHDYEPGSIIYNVDKTSQLMDISIKAPAGQPGQLTAIAQREIPKAYGVTARSEEREMEVLVLTAPRGEGKLIPSTTRGRSYTTPKEAVFSGAGIHGIAKTLAGNAGIPVVDETGLTGRYDATLNADLHNKEEVIKAVREQLGLELKPQTRKTKVLIVDKSTSV